MNRHDLMMSTRIRQALEARARRGIPDGVDLWPRLQGAAIAQNLVGTGGRLTLGSARRIILVVATCAALLTSGLAVAAAASPSLRHFLQKTLFAIPAGSAGAGIDAHGQPLQIQPLPPFPLFYPAWQPTGLLIRGVGQLHPSSGAEGFGWRYDCPAPPAACPPGITVFIPPHPAIGLPSLLTPFQGTVTDVVWFGSHAIPPDRRSIQIVEWDAATSPVKSLPAAAVPSLGSNEPETLLVLIRSGTTIAIETNLGSSVAQRVAGSLKPFTPSAR
jgi:hypothetical protein